MAIITPYPDCYVTDVVADQSYPVAPLIVWPILAQDVNAASSDSHNGRYNKGHASLNGAGQPKYQPTTLASGLNTGRTFNSVTGTWTDSWKSPISGQNGLLFDNQSANQSWEVVSSSTTSNIEAAEIIIGRGVLPNGVTPTNGNFFGILHLAYKSTYGDYRIVFAWGQPVVLQYFDPIQQSWLSVGVLRDFDKADYLWPVGGGSPQRIVITPYLEDNFITVQIGHGQMAVHGIPANLQAGQGDPTKGSYLPYPGNIRWVGQNGWTSLEYYPMRHAPLTVTKATRDYGVPHPNMGRAAINGNGLTSSPTDQSASYTLNTDGQNLGYSLTISRPDAGDGLGSANPPVFTDAVAVVPEVWASDLAGIGTPIYQLRVKRIRETSVLDDQNRVFTTAGDVTLNNFDDLYSGALGRKAFLFNGSNDGGQTLWQRCRGVLGVGPGHQFTRQDPTRLLTTQWSDMAAKMTNPMGVEFLLDRWHIYSAVHALATAGGIHPSFRQTIPSYVPPGMDPDAPYGPAGPDAPGPYILGSGSGDSPKYKFTPNMSAWDCLQILVRDMGTPDPNGTTRVIPWYMGFDATGQFRFEPYDPFSLVPVFGFGETADFQLGLMQWFELVNDVSQLRTDVTFEGLDALTNQLNYVHFTQPDYIKALVGWPSVWIERKAQWGSQNYMQRVAANALVTTALPTQIVRFGCVYLPFLYVGAVVLVTEWHTLGGTYPFVITRLDNEIGWYDNGQGIASTVVTARALFNFF